MRGKRSSNVDAESSGFTRAVRSNALWGSGSQGESRKNSFGVAENEGTPSGAGAAGEASLLTALAALTLVVPLAAGAKGGRPAILEPTFISPGLVEKGLQDPSKKLHVIIQSAGGSSDASNKVVGLGSALRKRLDLIGAVAVDIPAGKARGTGEAARPDRHT